MKGKLDYFLEEMNAELDSEFHYVWNKTKTEIILIYFLKPEPVVLHISQEALEMSLLDSYNH
jgi:hypothetical protein